MPLNNYPRGPLTFKSRRRKRTIFDLFFVRVDYIDPEEEPKPKPEKRRQFLPTWLRDELLGKLEDE